MKTMENKVKWYKTIIRGQGDKIHGFAINVSNDIFEAGFYVSDQKHGIFTWIDLTTKTIKSLQFRDGIQINTFDIEVERKDNKAINKKNNIVVN